MIPRLVAILALLAVGCGEPDPCDGRRDLATSPDGLRLAESEHEAGWGQTDCFQCHQVFEIHRSVCSSFTDTGLIDLTEVVARTDPGDTSTCVTCHGWNGVAAWKDLEDEEEEEEEP